MKDGGESGRTRDRQQRKTQPNVAGLKVEEWAMTKNCGWLLETGSASNQILPKRLQKKHSPVNIWILA